MANNAHLVIGINCAGKSTVIKGVMATSPEGAVVFNVADLMLHELGLTSRRQLEGVSFETTSQARKSSVLDALHANQDRPFVLLDTHMQIGKDDGEGIVYHQSWILD